MSIPDDDKKVLTPEALAGEDLDDWQVREGWLRIRFDTQTFATGLALVNRIGAEAERANHHPDLDVRYPYVEVALTSHDVGGLTRRDVRLARAISTAAADLGVAASTEA